MISKILKKNFDELGLIRDDVEHTQFLGLTCLAKFSTEETDIQ